MIILSRIREHFPVRRLEWLYAGILGCLGLRLLDPAETFAQPTFRELADWMSDGSWGTMLFAVGAARFLVLAYNGAWKPSPELRGIFSIFGMVVFLAFALGIETAGVASTGSITYAFLALGEASNIWTAATDARVPYKERLDGKPAR